MNIPDNLPEGTRDGESIARKVNEMLGYMREYSRRYSEEEDRQMREMFYPREVTEHTGITRVLPDDTKPASWSNKEKPVKEWQPMPGRPGYFTDPQGIMQNVARGEVPKEVLERFGSPEEPVTKGEE